jgi:hypothetical protein
MVLWVYVGFTFVALLLAWIVVTMFMTSGGERKPGAGIVALLVFGGVMGAVQTTVIPQIQLREAIARVEREALADPIITALKTYDTVRFNALMAGVKERMRNKTSREQTVQFIRAQGLAVFVEKTPIASDQAAHGLLSALAEMLTEMHSRDPKACYDFLTASKNSAVDPSSIVSGSTMQKLRMAIVEVIKAVAVSPQAVPREAEVQTARQAVAEELVRLYGRDVLMLLDRSNPKATGFSSVALDPSRYCQMSAALYRLAVRDTPEVSGKLARFLASLQAKPN